MINSSTKNNSIINLKFSIIKRLSILVIIILAFSCNKKSNKITTSKNSNFQTINYLESAEDFVNPERGFYRTASTFSSNFIPLDKNTLASYRKEKTIFGTQYSVSSSLLYRAYILDDFKNRPLSNDFLSDLNHDFEIAREAGMKIILRFSYIDDTHSGACPEIYVCPPYGDAPLSVVLEHISQLKPYLQQNADVIVCIQEGFIGIWGENYYTDYFGDASSNGQGRLMDNNWIDRNEVLKALLDAVPKDRMVQVRTPQIKQRYIYGTSAPISSPALTESEAFSGSDKARIGFYNDAFLSGPSDQGTYIDYGNSNSPPRSDVRTINTLKNYVKAESIFVVIGGETNDPSYTPKNTCDPSGMVEKEISDLHYSFLNAEYHQTVIGEWAKGGCLNSIKKKLGYRFVLQDATFPIKVNRGSILPIELNLKNVGFAAPFNDRPVQLILRNLKAAETIALNLNVNIRKWYPGNITIKDTLTIPTNIPIGTYDLLLNLPDKYTSLSKRAEYSIRLANTDIWEDSTGYNKLNVTVDVK
ncbi:MAG: DUF4832 domain-containing protein [Acidobacterium ailaaui]|nr:DUF4832 domain-containing protein [Pseudacidobacterium ailaaui]